MKYLLLVIALNPCFALDFTAKQDTTTWTAEQSFPSISVSTTPIPNSLTLGNLLDSVTSFLKLDVESAAEDIDQTIGGGCEDNTADRGKIAIIENPSTLSDELCICKFNSLNVEWSCITLP